MMEQKMRKIELYILAHPPDQEWTAGSLNPVTTMKYWNTFKEAQSQ